MQVQITALNRRQKTSQRTGKPFTSVGIKTTQHGERWLSGFGAAENAGWQVGDTVEVDVEEKNGYLNFSMPKAEKAAPGGDSNKLLSEIATRLGFMTVILKEIRDRLPARNSNGSLTPNFGERPPEPEDAFGFNEPAEEPLDPDKDIPF